MRRGYGILAGAVLLAVQLTGVASTIPFEDNFESYNSGDSLLGQNGWAAPTSVAPAAVTVSNMPYTYGGIPPITGGHTNAVVFETGSEFFSNSFAQVDRTNIWIDMLIYMQPAADPAEPMAGITNDTNKLQAAFFINSNGQLQVYHGDLVAAATYSNRLSGLPNASISGQWARLTVTMDYKSDTLAGLKFFQVQLDNGPAFTNVHAFKDPADIFQGTNGTWFLCANQGSVNDYLSSTHFSGSGYLDDFAVRDTFERFFTITPSATPANGGAIDPSNAVVVAEGGGTNFTITPATYWQITDVKINGGSIGPTNAYTFSNVLSDQTIDAYFALLRAANGTPYWWIAAQDPTWTSNWDTLEAGDQDGDGQETWKEWLCSTDPLDSNSYCRIVAVWDDSGSNVLMWTTHEVDPELPPFGLRRSTDLPADAWTLHLVDRSTSGSNVWVDGSTPVDESAYQLIATNAP